jgi:hypothetical protein
MDGVWVYKVHIRDLRGPDGEVMVPNFCDGKVMVPAP